MIDANHTYCHLHLTVLVEICEASLPLTTASHQVTSDRCYCLGYYFVLALKQSDNPILLLVNVDASVDPHNSFQLLSVHVFRLQISIRRYI